MAHQIIKQPNGNYSVYSTILEKVIRYNVSENNLLDYYGNRAKTDAKIDTRLLIARINSGEKAYHQFTLTWEEVKNTIPKDLLKLDKENKKEN